MAEIMPFVNVLPDLAFLHNFPGYFFGTFVIRLDHQRGKLPVCVCPAFVQRAMGFFGIFGSEKGREFPRRLDTLPSGFYRYIEKNRKSFCVFFKKEERVRIIDQAAAGGNNQWGGGFRIEQSRQCPCFRLFENFRPFAVQRAGAFSASLGDTIIQIGKAAG
jgi:hypothetical protein